MTKRFGRIAAAVAAPMALGGIALVGSPAPAGAAGLGWDYISVPTWLGNCPGGGSVKQPEIVVGDTWSGGDFGDDLVYTKVEIGVTQFVTGQSICYNGSRSYMGPAFFQYIHPTRSGQTWWVGPAGVTHN